MIGKRPAAHKLKSRTEERVARRDDRIDSGVAVYEDIIALAECSARDLELNSRDPEARDLSVALRRTIQALRLAVVADAEPAILMRIQLRLETMTRQVSTILANCEAKPDSQRVTAPPPSGLDPASLFQHQASPSERPTLRPDPPAQAKSGVVSKVQAPDSSVGKSRTGA